MTRRSRPRTAPRTPSISPASAGRCLGELGHGAIDPARARIRAGDLDLARLAGCDVEIELDEHEAIQGAKSAKIRTLNDRFRKSLTGGRVMMTAAVSALPDDVRAQARSKV
jgi:hypothetical protein